MQKNQYKTKRNPPKGVPHVGQLNGHRPHGSRGLCYTDPSNLIYPAVMLQFYVRSGQGSLPETPRSDPALFSNILPCVTLWSGSGTLCQDYRNFFSSCSLLQPRTQQLLTPPTSCTHPRLSIIMSCVRILYCLGALNFDQRNFCSPKANPGVRCPHSPACGFKIAPQWLLWKTPLWRPRPPLLCTFHPYTEL